MTDQPTEHTDDTAAPRGETTADPARRGGGATAFDPTAPDRRSERTEATPSEPDARSEPEERTQAEERTEADERAQPAERVEAPDSADDRADAQADEQADDARDRDATSRSASDSDEGESPEESAERERREDEERRRREEEFAREHDPANHDIAAGEEFRQRGDWTAQKAGGAQVWDSEGNLVEGTEDAGTLTGDDAPSADAPEATGTSANDGAERDERGERTGGTDSENAANAENDRNDAGNGDEGDDDRRVSSLEEVVDGGYSVGSAAPIDDDAMPLGHPVKAWHDTKTYLTPDAPGYEDAEPTVWFLDESFAQKAGFTRAP